MPRADTRSLASENKRWPSPKATPGATAHHQEIIRDQMYLLIGLSFAWLTMRTYLLVRQVKRHSDEAQLSHAFQQEIHKRGMVIPRL